MNENLMKNVCENFEMKENFDAFKKTFFLSHFLVAFFALDTTNAILKDL